MKTCVGWEGITSLAGKPVALRNIRATGANKRGRSHGDQHKER